jgi:hypothetical protein
VWLATISLPTTSSRAFKSSRNDLSAENIWRTYIVVTRVEAAFRAMKSPLCERPHLHHLERRVEHPHLPLCAGLSLGQSNSPKSINGRHSSLARSNSLRSSAV